MIIIKEMHVKKFRGIEDINFNFNKPVNAIIGKNGTMKTTVLGLIAQPFSLKTGSMSKEIPLTGGKSYNSPMRDKFKFSNQYDVPGEHEWTLSINNRVYEKEKITLLSEKRSDSGSLRFWSTEGRERGMNYIQCPVIYLSMKRLTPIGEEKHLVVEDASLTDQEKEFYIEKHNEILISTERINSVSDVHSSGKVTLGANTETYDAWSISAGQDNVGKIILAVLSMKRLKDRYPDDYKGGIICIDEIESTLYPAAQEKLVEFMYDTAQKIGLQYFFTTHSMSLISYLKTGKYNERNSIAYLQKIGGKIHLHNNPSLREIENDLYVSIGKQPTANKIKVYCEDEVGIMFCKSLLEKSMKERVQFETKVSMCWTGYRMLYQNKIPEFIDNIIVLDGDVKSKTKGWKNYPKNTNIAYLPLEVFPEKVFFDFLWSLDEEDPFWDSHLGGYNRTVCFRDCPNKTTDKDEIKAWFDSQKQNAGRGYCRFINEWKKHNTDEVNAFREQFRRAYNYVAQRTGFEMV